MHIPITSELKISSDVLSQEVGGEVVLLDLQSENYFGLDEVGTRFWQLLQQDNSLQQAHEVLLAEYDVQKDQLDKDLNDLISKLIDAGLISIEDAE